MHYLAVMSGELVAALKRRALSMLRSAKLRIQWGDYDLACFDAEQALQLYLKAVLLELFGEKTRVHGLIEHLSLLRKRLRDAVLMEEAEKISTIVRMYRPILDLLDDAYVEARYGSSTLFTEQDAVRAVQVVEEIIRELSDIVARVRGG